MANCNDFFEDIKQLQEQNAQLQKDLDASERARKAGEAFLKSEVKRQWVVQMKDGSVRSITDAEISRSYADFANRMSSEELDRVVQRGLGNKAKPVGAEGRFVNYRQLLENANVQNAEDYAKLSEALVGTWRELAPEDFAFVTETFGRERVLQTVADAYREFTDADTIAAALANNSAGFMNLAERMTRLRFLADTAKGSYLDTLETIFEYVQTTAAPVPAGLKQRAFSNYKLALMGQRHYSMAKNRTGKALRSLQDDFATPDKFRVDMAEATETLGMTAKDVSADENFGRVMQNIDDRGKGVEELRQLIIATKLDGMDPNAKLDKGWLNNHIRFGNALVKESQLGNVNSQVKMNLMGNQLMNVYGPIHQAFENIALLTPAGSKFSREAFGEGLRVAWESAGYAQQATRTAWRELASDAFSRGKAPLGGNLDTYGARMKPNDQLLAQVERTLDMPFVPGGPLQPRNWAMTNHKLHAAVSLLRYHWSGKKAAALTPALRSMSAVDSVQGYNAYVFKLKNDLEIRARRDGVQLGLFDQRSRDEWVRNELDKAFYQASPTEENIKAFRRERGLKGSDITDAEIAEIITAERVGKTYGDPTGAIPESAAAMDYSLRNRMQNTPTGELSGAVDAAVMEARKHWAVESLVPYWRAPFNNHLFDTRLSFGPLGETADAIFGKNPTAEQLATIKAGWVTTGGLLALFAGVDMLGLIEGNGPIDPEAKRAFLLEGRKPNSIAGIPYLGGLPVLNTLFLWKDIKETFVTGTYSNYDQYNAFWGIAQVLTSQIVRQTGFGQLQRLVDALLDPENEMPRLAQWLGQGQLPASGVMRDLQRFSGSENKDFYQGRAPGADERFVLGEDDFFTTTERQLRELAFGTIPLLGLPGGAPRKEADHLGQPIQLEFGADWKEAMKSRFHTRIWPRSYQKVYAELDAQGRLNLPQPLLTRQLEGVAMSGELQKEYNDTYGTVRGNIPLIARMEMGGQKVSISLPFSMEVPVDLRKQFSGAGVAIVKDGSSATVDLAPFLDKHVKGRSIIEAFNSLFNDPLYQRMQDRPGTTSDLEVRDMPPARRRRQAASQMIQGIYDYYHLLTLDQLNASDSEPAQEWRAKRAGMADQQFKQSSSDLQDLMEALGQPAPAGMSR
jgi:hypothetical protein